MQPSEIGKRLALVVVVALVVGAAFSTPLRNPEAATVGESLSVPSHQPDAILATTPEETGELSVNGTGQKHVVVDAAHENDFERSSIAPMIDALTESGHTVTFYRGDRGSSFNETLRSADALVVLSPQQPYTATERAGLDAFADAGGRVLLAGEPPSQESAFSSLFGPRTGQSATAPLTGLASSFGFGFGDSYVYDLQSYDGNYRNVYATPTDESTVGDGVGQVTVHEATTVSGGTPLLETKASTKLASTRDADTYALAARDGNVVVLGDASVLDTEWVQRNDNEAFVSGLLEFVVSGDKTPGAPAEPTAESPTPGAPGASGPQPTPPSRP